MKGRLDGCLLGTCIAVITGEMQRSHLPVIMERLRRVVIPQAFWWLSLIGSLILLSYAIQRRDSVFIAGQAFSWIPYLRNLWIHRRNKSSQLTCPGCSRVSPSDYRHCPGCGGVLSEASNRGGSDEASVLAKGH
jgi:hypothetical protein